MLFVSLDKCQELRPHNSLDKFSHNTQTLVSLNHYYKAPLRNRVTITNNYYTMSAEQIRHYHQLPEDLALRGHYIALCEHYLYYGVDILGSDIEMALMDIGTYGLEAAVEYINELYFGENGYYQLPGGEKVRPEYFILPLAPHDHDTVYSDDEDEITYE